MLNGISVKRKSIKIRIATCIATFRKNSIFPKNLDIDNQQFANFEVNPN